MCDDMYFIIFYENLFYKNQDAQNKQQIKKNIILKE